MITYNDGRTHKFTVKDDGRTVDCYLNIGFVEESTAEQFKHLEIGDICHIDLKVDIKTDEAKGLEIAFNIIREYIKDGAKIDTAIRVLKYQMPPPTSVMHEDEANSRLSICDYIGRYLEQL